MRQFLKRENIFLSKPTVHKYMNRELNLKSIVRRKNPGYKKAHAHKIFSNLLEQNFSTNQKNNVWCVDFTYLFLSDGKKRYNCSILDLYDRSIVASLTDKEITSRLAIRTVQKALNVQYEHTKSLILHSDQGAQFTSKEFIDFCRQEKITQSMSKAGCPYDNAPMERYYNTLKSECIDLHHFHSDEELFLAVDDFAYVWYNHLRPHSYNDYKTPFEKRYHKN